MARKLTEMTVFISCPSDVSELQGVAAKAIDELSAILKATHNLTLKAISWKADIVPGIGADAQQVINSQTIGQYDIYLGMMGSRFGTATARAGSGTEEEFDLAVNTFETKPNSIKILFYFKAFGANPLDIDIEHLTKVHAFKDKLRAKGVLYSELPNLDDALKSIKNHLTRLITDEWDQTGSTWKSTVPIAGERKYLPTSTQEPSESPDSGGNALQPPPLAQEGDDGSEAPPEELGLLELSLLGNDEIS